MDETLGLPVDAGAQAQLSTSGRILNGSSCPSPVPLFALHRKQIYNGDVTDDRKPLRALLTNDFWCAANCRPVAWLQAAALQCQIAPNRQLLFIL